MCRLDEGRERAVLFSQASQQEWELEQARQSRTQPD